MSICRGIATTELGMFLCATVSTQSRKCKIMSISEWNSLSYIKNFLLLNKKVNLVLPSQWIRTSPAEDADDLEVKSLPEGFHVCLRQSDIQHFSDLLTDNINAILPDMSLLLTLPRAFGKEIPTSYCSILNDHDILRVGIVTEMKLRSVFTATGIENSHELEGFIGRIERYWKNSVHEMRTPFPSGIIYSVNELPFEHSEDFPVSVIDCGTQNPEELKAAGAALCDTTEESLSFIPFRTGNGPIIKAGVFWASCTLIAASLLLTATLFLYKNHTTRTIAEIKSQYNNLLDNNGDIRSLIEQGDSKARRLLQRNSLVNQPTTWGRFLQTIGASRPENLYFERLGSEPDERDSAVARIVISGWSRSETVVTDFIKTLSASPLLGNVSLSSMERIPKEEHSCKFKIVCKLTLSQK